HGLNLLATEARAVNDNSPVLPPISPCSAVRHPIPQGCHCNLFQGTHRDYSWTAADSQCRKIPECCTPGAAVHHQVACTSGVAVDACPLRDHTARSAHPCQSDGDH